MTSISLDLITVVRGVDSDAHFTTVYEQSESNPDCSFHSSVVFRASRRSY